jgi:hypothetical protein
LVDVLDLEYCLGYYQRIESNKRQEQARNMTTLVGKPHEQLTRVLQRADSRHREWSISRVAPGRCTMGDRITNRQVLRRKADTLSEPEIAEVLDYINIMESLREQAKKPDLFDDELMNLLADALENRRARVVSEWDRVRRRADTRASSFVSSRKLM